MKYYNSKIAINEQRNLLELKIFFFITYVLSLLLGISIYFNQYIDSEIMGLFMMILPATGVSVAKIYKNSKSDENIVFHYILISNFCLYLFFIILGAIGLISSKTISSFIHVLALIINPLVVCYACLDGKELYPFKNIEKVIKPILAYTLIMVICSCIMAYSEHVNYLNLIVNLIMVMLFIPATLLINSVYFFGEEYGWRGFLQEKLQKRFGKRKGIILLGVLWELWHIPLWLNIYNADCLGVSITIIYIISFSIFLGYVYMKSNNVWACALIHAINNSMFISEDLSNISLNFNISTLKPNVIAAIFVLIIFFSTFIFSKEYKTEVEIEDHEI